MKTQFECICGYRDRIVGIDPVTTDLIVKIGHDL